MSKMRLLPSQNGKAYVLISTVLLLLTIALIGASLLLFFFSVNLKAQTGIDETKAFYLAEAGLSYAAFTLHSQSSTIGTTEQVLGPMDLGEGKFVVEINYLEFLITSTGEVNGAKKTLQMQFSAL